MQERQKLKLGNQRNNTLLKLPL